ncbi:uncharacterized protein LOC130248418 [Oenanthe melanoleuca]|uniref:uncharacterized protein LOC130248418 n=1 Tax=Oenanthe melanoleuca TaxID=2939378 RepID=UPI0024C0FB1D|nr:uncharacterized protein LOC130248418 [Oenanthe melanoleuca]
MPLKMDMPLAKAGPIRDSGNACDNIFKKKTNTKWAEFLAREEREVRMCEGKLHGDTKVSKEVGGRRFSRHWNRDSSAACGETMVRQLTRAAALQLLGSRGMQRSTHSPWGSMGMQRSTHSPWIHGDTEIHPQPMGSRGMQRSTHSPWASRGMQRSTHSLRGSRGMQRSTHSPWGSMGDAEIHPQPMEEVSTPEQVDAWRSCDPVGDPVKRGGPDSRLEQPVLGGLHPMERETHTAAVLGGLCAHGRGSHAAAHDILATLEKVTESCLPWEGTPQSHRGRTPLPEQQKSLGGKLTKPLYSVSLHYW